MDVRKFRRLAQDGIYNACFVIRRMAVSPIFRRPGIPWAIVLSLVLAVSASAQTKASPEQRTARYFDSIRPQPSLLLPFLQEMPKGGDLHNHLWGAIYAESFIDYSAKDGLCVDRTTSILLAPPCDKSCERYASKPAVQCAYQDHILYNSIVDAWSMRNWTPDEGSGHDHFFATFDKFAMTAQLHTGDMIAEARARAAADHLQYLELMQTADGDQASQLGLQTGWDDDFAAFRQKLLSNGMNEVVAATRRQLDVDEATSAKVLKCNAPRSDPGCDVKVRYLYQVLRGLPREMVFAQILLGFELAQADPRFVGLNLVMPEDWYVPMHDFDLHMRILDYMHGVYPKVHISLHADELAMGLVPPEGLRFHIRESLERGHAERIGHGVAIMNEHDPLQLMHEMAQKNILVEISLTSNDLILGISGKEHPLPTYQKEGVPVALATDDQGVSRSDMTHEWLRAAQTYDYKYSDMKRFARQSLEHSFLPGSSLWSSTKDFKRAAACVSDIPGAKNLSAACGKFLAGSERAQAQWKLESEFAAFEARH
jgi:adenosine deaminase